MIFIFYKPIPKLQLKQSALTMQHYLQPQFIMCDKFIETHKLYVKRYKMTLPSFMDFVTKQISLGQMQINQLKEKVSTCQLPQQLTQENFFFLLHLISALQAKQSIQQMQYQQLKNYTKLRFLTKNEKDNKSIEEKSKPTTTLSKQPELKNTISSEFRGKLDVIKESSAANQDSKTDNDIQMPAVSQGSGLQKPLQKTQMPQQQQKKQIERQEVCGGKQKVTIELFDKTSQDYISVVIKYKMFYTDGKKTYDVMRRYSEFQKLMSYLEHIYEGTILPELPPKEGIKSTLSYFYGIDINFLEDRKKRLELMINRLFEIKLVRDDPCLKKFLTESEFQIQSLNESSLDYLNRFAYLAMNTNQIKDYGLAYYKYILDQKNNEVNTSVTQKYLQITPLLENLNHLVQYRLGLIANMTARAQLFQSLGIKTNAAQLPSHPFDLTLAQLETDMKALKSQYSKYLHLKKEQSWHQHVLQQKQGQTMSKVWKESTDALQALEKRLKKIETNLLESFEEFKKEKGRVLNETEQSLLEWRKNLHP